jgi:hypothetical protein
MADNYHAIFSAEPVADEPNTSAGEPGQPEAQLAALQRALADSQAALRRAEQRLQDQMPTTATSL